MKGKNQQKKGQKGLQKIVKKLQEVSWKNEDRRKPEKNEEKFQRQGTN